MNHGKIIIAKERVCSKTLKDKDISFESRCNQKRISFNISITYFTGHNTEKFITLYRQLSNLSVDKMHHVHISNQII